MNGAGRVRYAEGQRLRAADLAAEQEYLVALERTHNLTHHGPGIVVGLDPGQDLEGEAIIGPGAAVGGDGNLLVLDSGALTEPDRTLDFWLIRCEIPRRVSRPGRTPCGPARADRIVESARVVALAPGTGAPVEGAVSLGSAPRRYTSLAAAETKHPRGRAVMQVGPATGHDRYGFLVSTAGPGGGLQPRIGVDRFGSNFFFGTVTAAAYRASATIMLSQSQALVISALTPGADGERLRVMVRSVPVGGVRRFSIRFLSGPAAAAGEIVLTEDAIAKGEGRVGGVVRFSRAPIVAGRLRRRSGGPVAAALDDPDIAFIHVGDDTAEVDVAPEATSKEEEAAKEVVLQARGGTVELKGWPAAAGGKDVEIRGCVESQPGEQSLGRGPNGLSFRPFAKAPKEPPAAGMWSVRTGSVELPAEELRLDLGARKKGDVSQRFALGNDDTGEFVDWMTIRGTGAVTVWGDVRVSGEVRAGPLRADHTDPDFTNLLVRAWLEGLAAALDASNEVRLEIRDEPAIIKIGVDWSYTLRVHNGSSAEIKVGRLFETLTITGAPAPHVQVITSQEKIASGGYRDIVIQHSTTLEAGLLSIEMRVSGRKGDAAWWTDVKTGAGQEIPVVKLPAVDLSDLPDSVPANQPWSHRIEIRNDSAEALTLTALTIERNGVPANVAIADPAIGPNATVTFGPFQENPMAGALTVLVTGTVMWSDGTTANVTNTKTIAVNDDLGIYAVPVVAPSTASAWTYDLTVSNAALQGVTILSIKQGINAPQQAIPGAANVDIPAGGAIVLEDVDGSPVNQPPNTTFDLVFEIQYRRDDQRTFTFTGQRGGITVT